MLFWCYTLPMLLSLIQGAAMLLQPHGINAMRTRELFDIQDYIWKRLGFKSWDTFLFVCILVTAITPVVNLWSYVVATGVDLEPLFRQFKSWAKDKRFEVFGSERRQY